MKKLNKWWTSSVIKKMNIKTKFCILLIGLLLLTGCSQKEYVCSDNSIVSSPEKCEIIDFIHSENAITHSAKLVIEDDSDSGTYTHNPSIFIENTGSNIIKASIDVSILEGNKLLQKENNVLFLAGIGESIDEIYPGESVRGYLNYMDDKDTRYDWKLQVDLRNGASAKIITSDYACLNLGCEDIKNVKLKEVEELIPWEEYFEQCISGLAKTTYLSNKNYYIDECESEYSVRFNLPEYCEKVDDFDKKTYCWKRLAVNNYNEEFCENLHGVDNLECIRNVNY